MFVFYLKVGVEMKALRWLDRYFEEVILCTFTILMVVVLFMQIIFRNLTPINLTWSEELARYLFIWVIYIGVSYAVKKERHIRIDSLELVFKERGKLIMGTISNTVFLIFSLMVVYYGFGTVFNINRATPGLGISYGWVYASTLIGFLLTTIRLIQAQIKLMRHKTIEEEV